MHSEPVEPDWIAHARTAERGDQPQPECAAGRPERGAQPERVDSPKPSRATVPRRTFSGHAMGARTQGDAEHDPADGAPPAACRRTVCTWPSTRDPQHATRGAALADQRQVPAAVAQGEGRPAARADDRPAEPGAADPADPPALGVMTAGGRTPLGTTTAPVATNGLAWPAWLAADTANAYVCPALPAKVSDGARGVGQQHVPRTRAELEVVVAHGISAQRGATRRRGRPADAHPRRTRHRGEQRRHARDRRRRRRRAAGAVVDVRAERGRPRTGRVAEVRRGRRGPRRWPASSSGCTGSWSPCRGRCRATAAPRRSGRRPAPSMPGLGLAGAGDLAAAGAGVAGRRLVEQDHQQPVLPVGRRGGDLRDPGLQELRWPRPGRRAGRSCTARRVRRCRGRG